MSVGARWVFVTNRSYFYEGQLVRFRFDARNIPDSFITLKR